MNLDIEKLLLVELFFSLGTASIIMTADSNILYSNDEAETLLGEALKGRNLTEFMPETPATPHTTEMKFHNAGKVADRIALLKIVGEANAVPYLIYNQYPIEFEGSIYMACNFRPATPYEIKQADAHNHRPR